MAFLLDCAMLQSVQTCKRHGDERETVIRKWECDG